MANITEKIKSAYKGLTDAEVRLKREKARQKVKIAKMELKSERDEAKGRLEVETLKRKAEIAKAKASLRRAQVDKAHAGVALTSARQARARSILSWAGVFRVKGPSAETKKRVKAGAKTVGKGIGKWWGGVGRDQTKDKKRR